MIYIGIDPGWSGGLAILNDQRTIVMLEPMPSTEADIWRLIVSRTLSHSRRGVIEFVRSSPKMGVASAFKFGWSYGLLRFALIAAEIPFEEVLPRKWRQSFGCAKSTGPIEDRDKVVAKNITKAKAQELFPGVNITHATADALLLAEYCRRLEVR